VIDDPQSIIRCGNKVFLAEALVQHDLPTPRTVVGNRFNLNEIVPAVGLPCVLKYPDSAFSQGVSRCETEEELVEKATGILEVSDLFIAQEFLPTEFDWRVGVFEQKPLYACRYHMVDKHWQIVRHHGASPEFGKIEPIPLDLVPTGRRAHGRARGALRGRRALRRRPETHQGQELRDGGQRQPEHRRGVRGLGHAGGALPHGHAGPVGPAPAPEERARRPARASLKPR
jgi:hypothetical protein